MNYSTPTTVSTIDSALKAQIRASIEKYGVVPVNADDLLATDKIKVARYLKQYGLTLTDLIAEYPNFWTLDDNVRGFLLGQFIGPIRRAAKRLKRMIARGYPADYDSLSRDDRRRVSAAVRQRRRRAKAAKPAPTPRAPRSTRIPFERVCREWRDDRLASLTAYTAGSGPRQRQLRGHERQLVKAALLYHALTAELRRAPTHRELANKMRVRLPIARNLVRRLESLYGVAGPWRSKA